MAAAAATAASAAAMPQRAAELVATLKLKPHPEGGHYAEVFRSAHVVQMADGSQMPYSVAVKNALRRSTKREN